MIESTNNDDRHLRLLRQYLIGGLDAAPRAVLESVLYPKDGSPSPESERVTELLQVAEDELIDEYQLGHLDFRERRDMALHFSWNAARRRKLGLVTKLVALAESAEVAHAEVPAQESQPTIATESQDSQETAWTRLRWNFSPSPTWATAVAALLVVVVGAVSFRTGQMTQVQPAQVIEARLPPGPVDRASGGTVRVPAGAAFVHLSLDIGLNEFETYSAELFELRDADERMIHSVGRLSARPLGETFVVGFVVDGEMLGPGSYSVLLRGVDAAEEPVVVARFLFRVEA